MRCGHTRMWHGLHGWSCSRAAKRSRAFASRVRAVPPADLIRHAATYGLYTDRYACIPAGQAGPGNGRRSGRQLVGRELYSCMLVTEVPVWLSSLILTCSKAHVAWWQVSGTAEHAPWSMRVLEMKSHVAGRANKTHDTWSTVMCRSNRISMNRAFRFECVTFKRTVDSACITPSQQANRTMGVSWRG